MLADIALPFTIIAAALSQIGKSLVHPDSPSSSTSSTSPASSTSHASPVPRDKGPDAWKTGYPERNWHKTCCPATAIQAYSKVDDLKFLNELDLDLCLTNNDGTINNFDNNTLKPINGHQRHPNGHFSENCDCWLQWGFLNGSLMCRCGMESVKNQALNTIWVFEDAIVNDKGNVSCLLGNQKMYAKKMEGCPKLPPLPSLQKQPGH